MVSWGMVKQGVECIRNTRLRYDGDKRNPWTRPSAGTTMRASSAWSPFVMLSGFSYNGATASVVAASANPQEDFQSFWSTGTGWGKFSLRNGAGGSIFTLRVLSGTLACRSCEMPRPVSRCRCTSGGEAVESRAERRNERLVTTLGKTLHLAANDELRIEVHG